MKVGTMNFNSRTDLNLNEIAKNNSYLSKDFNSDDFWQKQSQRIDWISPFSTLKKVSYKSPVNIQWYLGGKLNVTVNCVDRHLKSNAEKVAFIFEPDDVNEKSKKITYRELHDQVSRMGNVLRKHGVKKGDRVTIYMPMIPEAVYAMLACARIGAIHSVVFGGFSPDSLVHRIHDCESSFVITADEGRRGGKKIPLKKNIDEALKSCPTVKKVLVIKHTGAEVPMMRASASDTRDLWWHEEATLVSNDCTPEVMDSEDPLFILYTSGSTGKPKGVLHTTAGYLVYASYTHEFVFNYKSNDIYWCTADVGWVTGHSYIVYGPLSNCATSIIFEGIPNFPDASRFWQVVDKHQVNIFYTAPTALRALMKEGDDLVKKTNRNSLRVLGTVGEPINPEAWIWYHEIVGDKRCSIVDTWWQTETGGILISPIANATKLKPGSATFPLPGIKAEILDQSGKILSGPAEGFLVLADSWPGQMRTVFRDHQRFEQTYFSQYQGYYFTGDGCKRDEDGYYWITGRVDDVINVAGHRLGTAEIESALVGSHFVAEAAVIGYPHTIKGQGIYAFVTLKNGVTPTETLKSELTQWVSKTLSPIAKPDQIQFSPGLPKTRSGKIMRRILRKIVDGHLEALGDISTLADPSVVEELTKNRAEPPHLG